MSWIGPILSVLAGAQIDRHLSVTRLFLDRYQVLKLIILFPAIPTGNGVDLASFVIHIALQVALDPHHTRGDDYAAAPFPRGATRHTSFTKAIADTLAYRPRAPNVKFPGIYAEISAHGPCEAFRVCLSDADCCQKVRVVKQRYKGTELLCTRAACNIHTNLPMVTGNFFTAVDYRAKVVRLRIPLGSSSDSDCKDNSRDEELRNGHGESQLFLIVS